MAVICLIVGGLFLKETNHTRIWDEVHNAEDPDNGRVPQPA